jgi:hypothetical protein
LRIKQTLIQNLELPMTEKFTPRTTKNVALTNACFKNLAIAFAVLIFLSTPLHADCIVPDNGLGTADLPVPCDYISPTGDMHIVDGLALGDSIDMDAVLTGMAGLETPVGVYAGGNTQTFSGVLKLPMIGTGTLTGFSRPSMLLNVTGVSTSDPRIPASPIQSFNQDLFQLQGQIIGDPDFDLLRISAGTGFGLPSPGHTTLTQAPGANWAVDSFFDITYRIDFIGRPGGMLAGRSGSTTGTIRLQTEPVPEPSAIVLLTLGGFGMTFLAARRKWRNS